ncbi:MAG: hypothetical protein KKE50_00915 [Nanoarchaeota archaeon]|nr:hypothetical protein [Nanoarchaeota archaeon]
MNKELLLTLKILFVIWALVIFFFYYRQEILHNLDHLPLSIREIVQRLGILKILVAS